MLTRSKYLYCNRQMGEVVSIFNTCFKLYWLFAFIDKPALIEQVSHLNVFSME